MIEISGPEAVTLVNNLLAQSESARFESKREMVGKALETLCAFANTSAEPWLWVWKILSRPWAGTGSWHRRESGGCG